MVYEKYLQEYASAAKDSRVAVRKMIGFFMVFLRLPTWQSDGAMPAGWLQYCEFLQCQKVQADYLLPMKPACLLRAAIQLHRPFTRTACHVFTVTYGAYSSAYSIPDGGLR